MKDTATQPDKAGPTPLNFKEGLAWSIVAIVAFHLAYSFPAGSFLIAVYLYALFRLTHVRTSRQAMYLGWACGLLLYGPQLLFFWNLFGSGAVALWLVLAFWLGLFLLLIQSCRMRLGRIAAAVAAPFVWTGLEYFRRELYVLRFSWLNAGYAFADSPALPVLKFVGMYGVGFVLMAMAAIISQLPRTLAVSVGAAMLIVLGIVTNLPTPDTAAANAADKVIPLAGVQLEFPSEQEVLNTLERLHNSQPQAQLLVLSEYTFNAPVPDRIRAWCRTNQLYLIAGGKEFLKDDLYNTAFVIGPNGGVVFQQAKAVPIQFFKDGRPAPQQRLWDSPWGLLGICICYDLSYTRVVDELVRQGARALIVPTMDVEEWGAYEHRLHSRVAPVRAAECGLQIFRLASSGISQWVDERGRVLASAPFPGQESVLAAQLHLKQKGARPMDRVLAPTAIAVTVLLAGWMALLKLREKLFRR